jgi:hypothetical protein
MSHKTQWPVCTCTPFWWEAVSNHDDRSHCDASPEKKGFTIDYLVIDRTEIKNPFNGAIHESTEAVFLWQR